ncbi:MAG: YceI family protein [Candidatus Hydrogenedentales bacterium]
MPRCAIFYLPLVFVFGLLGCADPAANAPAALVAAPIAVDETDALDDADAVTYTISDDSKLTFVGSKVTGSHDGGFNEFDGVVVVANEDPTQAQITVNIDATSIWADNERLTNHLKSADFFDIEKYPTAQFVSTKIEAAEDGYIITGNLDLHGQSKSVEFPAQIEIDADVLTANADFSITRTDWGINYKGKPDDLIRERVVVRFEITAERGDAQAANEDA